MCWFFKKFMFDFFVHVGKHAAKQTEVYFALFKVWMKVISSLVQDKHVSLLYSDKFTVTVCCNVHGQLGYIMSRSN